MTCEAAQRQFMRDVRIIDDLWKEIDRLKAENEQLKEEVKVAVAAMRRERERADRFYVKEKAYAIDMARAAMAGARMAGNL